MSQTPGNEPGQAADALFDGGGEMGARMRAQDWGTTPLGPPAAWPRSLRTVVRILLTSRYAMWMGWGPELSFFYNDAYAPTLGTKRAWALGSPARRVWAEIWPAIGPRIATVLSTGRATWDEGLLLFLERSGYPEETYHTFSYSPLPDDLGGIGGMLCVVTEETERLIGERRLALLRDVASGLAASIEREEVFASLSRSLAAEPRDLPFTLTYLFDPGGPGGGPARLACRTGIAAGHPAAPEEVALAPDAPNAASAAAGDGDGAGWPLAAVLDGAGPVEVDLSSRGGDLPGGPWDRPPGWALVLPIARQGQARPAGAFVAALNPYRPLDGDYRSFLALFVGQVAAGLANANAYEEERRRAEALAEIDRAKTVFFSNVSHELRTPLTLLLGPVEELLGDATLPAAAKEQLALVQRNALRLLRLVNALLDFSRLEAGRIRALYEPTDLAASTAELASLFRSAVERAGLAFEVDAPSLGEPVYVDRDMWEKIVLNLLSNAFKFTLAGGISVRLAREDGAARLSVADTGSGIPEGELPHLFERFHRVEGAAGRTHEGTGIGLALVDELVKLHGGSIAVDSELGRGSTFTVRVPLGTAHLPPDRIGAAGEPSTRPSGGALFVEEALRWLPGGPRPSAERPLEPAAGTDGTGERTRDRILLADDNADMRDYLARLLADRYEVEAVGDGRLALAAARARPPALVVSDVMMPGLDGFGLLRELRADPALAGVPVVLLSARAGEEAVLEGMGAGADHYLVKPFSARELLARVAAQIERRTERRREEERRERLLRRELAARQEAERLNRMKDEFLATLSHELRTPLNAMLGWSQLLLERGDGAAGLDEARLRQGLAAIERNARAQTRMIEDLLDMSRIVAGKIRLDVQPVDLAGIIDEAVQSLLPAAEAKGVRIERAVAPPDGLVSGDAGRLQQVFWNLLSNGVKFTPRGGRVEVSLARDGAQMEVRFEDTGRGIEPEFLPAVFDRFRQADGSITREHGGLGLGLSIVKQLVELHGGTVRAESAGRGRGAAFVVSLPLAAAD